MDEELQHLLLPEHDWKGVEVSGIRCENPSTPACGAATSVGHLALNEAFNFV
jgi:hypothetical protein